MDGARTGVRGRPDPSGQAPRRRDTRIRGVAPLTVSVIAAGRTGPNRDLRFGSEHLDLDETGRRDCRRLVEVSGVSSTGHGPGFCGPEASVAQTAALLGVVATPDPDLATLELGRWRGNLPEDIPVGELRAWFTDVTAAPHGGESIAQFLDRVGRWYDTHVAAILNDDPASAVTVVAAMPVVQALVVHVGALGVDEFWSVEIEPGSARLL